MIDLCLHHSRTRYRTGPDIFVRSGLKTGDRIKSSGPVSELKNGDFIRSGPVRLRYLPDNTYILRPKNTFSEEQKREID